jgi:hypothetical protein
MNLNFLKCDWGGCVLDFNYDLGEIFKKLACFFYYLENLIVLDTIKCQVGCVIKRIWLFNVGLKIPHKL